MGGEFYLAVKSVALISQMDWTTALHSSMLELQDLYVSLPGVQMNFDVEAEVAFHFTDCAPPKQKAFKLNWKWGPDTVGSNLGGRRRGEWSTVAFHCERLCNRLPGKLALVVSEGFCGYDDDGDGKGYKQCDYGKWPWTKWDGEK